MRAVVVALLAGCGDEWLQYAWNDQRVLCSMPVDDLVNHTPDENVDDELDRARRDRTVALMHAHHPEVTISPARLDRLLDGATARGLEFLTYSELVRGDQRAGLALAFDDDFIDAWSSIRGALISRGARVTFFVTRYPALDDRRRALLAELVADGHAVAAHSIDHVNGPQYVKDHGLATYLDEQVLPSVQILEEAGYLVDTFAYPFGASTPELDAAVLEHVDRVRVSPGSCPF